MLFIYNSMIKYPLKSDILTFSEICLVPPWQLGLSPSLHSADV
jgi:hypothetical protein